MYKLLNVVITSCAKGWRYDVGSCYFNTKVILSLFLWMNISSLLIFILGKKETLNLTFRKTNYFPIGFLIIAFPLFLILSLAFPKKKILNKKVELVERKKYLIMYWGYIGLSIILMILAGLLG